jgi:altronate dehydratase small subunit
MSQAVIVVDEKDNVATALRALEEGESIEVAVGDRAKGITVRQAIPFGHKVALTDIQRGQPVIKYGEEIGLATNMILAGQHTHIHNVVGPERRENRA